MERTERTGDLVVGIQQQIRGARATLWTSLPAILQSYDPATMTATVQPAIQAQMRDKEGKWSNVTLPLLTQVPVQFPSGGGFTLTFPLKSGDEGLVIFSARCIDAWWQNGGIQPQAEVGRMHDLSDGMFIPGFFSQKKKLDNVKSDRVQLRNADASTFLEITEDNKLNATASGGINLNGVLIDAAGNVTFPGTITWPKGTIGVGGDEMIIQGTLTATGDVVAGQGGVAAVHLGTHRHSGVLSGGAQSGPPVAGS